MYPYSGVKRLDLFGLGRESRASALDSVTASFRSFYNGITLIGDQREICNTRRANVVSKLQNKFHITDSFATGSIPKFTALCKPNSDVDVMVVLHFGKHIQNKKPSQVLQEIRDAIGVSYSNVRKNGQAVTVYYTTWPNVDIVPVAAVENNYGNIAHYLVPDMNTETWIKSKPKSHAEAISLRASSFGPEFRRILKMAKWWNLKHSEYLQSYHIEVMALETLTGSFADYPWNVFQFFKNAHGLVSNQLRYQDSIVDSYLSYSYRQEALKRLATARDIARDAWWETYKENPDSAKAKQLWGQIFGNEFR